jgi:integrase
VGLGIKVKDMSDYDSKSRRFKSSRIVNKKLNYFEAEKQSELESLQKVFGNNVPLDVLEKKFSKPRKQAVTQPDKTVKLTLMYIAERFESDSVNGAVYNKRTGSTLSPATIATNTQTSRMVLAFIRKYGDFDFSMYNVGTISLLGESVVRSAYATLSGNLKTFLKDAGYDETSTLPMNLSRVKGMVSHYCSLHGINIAGLLDDLKSRKMEKDVITLSNEQVDFVLRNFDGMCKNCTPSQYQALQYWYVALILNPRVADMNKWGQNNIIERDGSYWLRYFPNKTKSSAIEVPLPAKVMEIFSVNIQRYGKLLPPVDHNLNRILKSIAAKYDVFQNEVHILKNGVIEKVKMCDHIHIHMMRSSGISHKLMNGWNESMVKETSGHTHDSRAFKRYVKIHSDAKMRVAEEYYRSIGA